MFYLDLDEIDLLIKKFLLISRNRFNLYSFRNRDHWILSGKDTKDRILQFLTNHGIDATDLRIRLLTHLAVFGYNFNPVSFYFCFDQSSQPVCAIAEVGNTFGEQKLFFMGKEHFLNGAFSDRQTKYFYVSPFINMDTDFDFHLAVPDETLLIRINGLQEGRKFFLSSLTGKRKPLTDAKLWWYLIRFPLITLQVIAGIHWQALKLFLKKLPYHKKEHFPELQREVIYGRNS
jgi:hypothetical protein